VSNPHLRPGRVNGISYHGIVSTPPACERCPLRFKKKVLPDGPVPAKIAFVGEEPGRVEERQGKGFVGPSGRLLWEALGPAIGFQRSDVWVSNAALCRSERVRLDNGAVLPREVVQQMATECCHRRLLDELRVVDPVVIVPLGNVALKHLTGVSGAKIFSYRGSISEVDLGLLVERLQR
jgi:uracil-DNA glycosylase family 4